MPDLFDTFAKEVISQPTNARGLKVLAKAKELGWHENPYVSMVIRLTKEGAEPFFARWDLGVTGSGKPSWRFQGARAANGQPLNYNDISVYLEDPSVILPEDPEENTPEATGNALGGGLPPLSEWFDQLESRESGNDCNDS